MLPPSPLNRLPYTTWDRPRRIGRSRRGQSSGSYSRSASWISTSSPRTCSSPVRIAAALPRLAGWRTSWTVESSMAVRIWVVPSVDPSSTTTISRSTGSSTRRMRRSTSATVLRSLYTGTMTERVRPSGSRRSSSLMPVTPEPLGGAGHALVQPDLRLPAQDRPGQGEVGTALRRVVDRAGVEHQLRRRAGDLQYALGQVEDGELVGVADVHRTDVVRVQQGQQAANLVVHVAEASGLQAVPVHGKGLAGQGLDDEVRHHPPVVGAHAWTVG